MAAIFEAGTFADGVFQTEFVETASLVGLATDNYVGTIEKTVPANLTGLYNESVVGAINPVAINSGIVGMFTRNFVGKISKVGAVAGITINADTGVISIDTSLTGELTNLTVDVTETNSAGNDSQTFTLSVNDTANLLGLYNLNFVGLIERQPIVLTGLLNNNITGLISAQQSIADTSPTAWYDIQDLSTLWQDTGASTAVTTPGQSVSRIDDKSGNGNHLTFSSGGSRAAPTLANDGTNNYLSLPAFTGFDMTNGVGMTNNVGAFSAWAAVYGIAATSARALHAFSTNGSLFPRFEMRIDVDEVQVVARRLSGDSTVAQKSGTALAGGGAVIAALVDYTNGTCWVRHDGSASSTTALSSSGSTAAANSTYESMFWLENSTLYIGTGRYYGGVLFKDSIPSAGDINIIETELGALLP